MKSTTIGADSKKLLDTAFPQGGGWLVRGHYNAADKLAMLEEGPAGSFALPDEDDLYYCVGSTTAGRTAVGRVWVLVIDDVGKEIDKGEFDLGFPMDPSFVVESSPGSYQYGYLIDGGMDPSEFKALRAAMKASPCWGAAHNIGAAAIYRLPSGTHTKAKYGGWKVRLEAWTGNVYSPEQIWQAAPAGAARAVPPQKRFEWTLGDDALQELVDMIPNPLELGRRDWVRIAHGISGAGGDLEIFDSFTSRWAGGYDAKETERVWDTLPTSLSGGGLLREEAEKADPGRFEKWRLRWEPSKAFDDGVDVTAEVEAGEEPARDATGFVLDDPKKLPRRDWLYGKRLIRRYVSATVATGGSGKSSLVLAEVMAMVSGKALLGVAPRSPLNVWVWNGEDDRIELARRIHAICLHHGVVAGDIAGRLFVDSGRDLNLVLAASGKGGAVAHKANIEAVKRIILNNNIDVVVLDPFVSAHRVNENDNMEIDMVVKILARIAEECDCAIDIVHHVRKPGNGATGGGSVDDARGASALINATRHARVLTGMPENIATKMGVINHRAYFAIQHGATKANMIPPSVGADWYRFESVDLGNGEPFPADGLGALDGDDVGVVVKWTPPAVSVTHDPAVVIAAQDLIAKGDYRADKRASNWVGPVISGVLGIDLNSTNGKQVVIETINDWISRGWLKIEDKPSANRHLKPHVVVGEKPEEGVFE